MIYKFKSKEKDSNYIELEEIKGNLNLSICVDNNKLPNIEISPNTLYDMIGALHSIQTKIKKGGQNG